MTQGINMLSIFSLAKSKNNNIIQAEGTDLTGHKRSFDESRMVAFSESYSKEENKKMKTK